MKVMNNDSNAGILDMPGEYVAVKKPIKMGEPKRFTPIHVANGDTVHFTLTNRMNRKETIGPIAFTRSMAIDTMIPLEVIDEFGLDVGVGCLCGQSKK